MKCVVFSFDCTDLCSSVNAIHWTPCDHCVLFCFSADIPEQLKKCCNYAGDEYFYPSQAEIMKYAVVVVTLATATRYGSLFISYFVFILFSNVLLSFSYILVKPLSYIFGKTS
jgi:hypothetical protein